MGLFDTDNNEEENSDEEEEELELECHYDCDEVFSSHEERIAHSMEKHTDLDPTDYPTITGRDNNLL